MNKFIACVTSVVLVGGSVYGYNFYRNSNQVSAEEIVKEVKVSKGSVTAGVTESAAVNVESLQQTYDLVLTSTSVSASVESGSGSGGSSAPGMGGGMNMGGMTGTGSGGGSKGGSGNLGSTSVSSKSESSSVELVIEKVLITEGQSVKKGDVIMTITQDSIESARTKLTEAVNDAELALKQAQIEEDETKLSAQFDYDTRIAEGEKAKSVYDTALKEIAQNITDLYTEVNELYTEYYECEDETKLTQLAEQIEDQWTKIRSAENSRASEELSAKQTYEEAAMYYDNAKDLYDASVNDVGSAAEKAKEAVEEAKADLETFEEYIKDGSITAEYSGTITGVGYAPGDTLSSDTAIASYADAESITVTVNVTEDDISAVTIGDSVDISFLSYPDEVFAGYVSEIGSSSSGGNSATVSYPVTVVVTSTPETLLSGMTANVTFITKQVKNVLYVSNKAVTNEGTDSYVLKKMEDGSENKIRVEVGFSNGSVAEIKGVEEGDTLLIKGKVS